MNIDIENKRYSIHDISRLMFDGLINGECSMDLTEAEEHVQTILRDCFNVDIEKLNFVVEHKLIIQKKEK